MLRYRYRGKWINRARGIVEGYVHERDHTVAMLVNFIFPAMPDKVIPIAHFRAPTPLAVPADLIAPSGRLSDQLSRPLRDLRISVTDRCNFRCVYCMPKQVFNKDYQFLPHTQLLSFEEIVRLAHLFVQHGVEKIRLTGGEPLLRRHLDKLVGMLAALRTPSGAALDLTLTTNGSLLAKKARALKDAGLTRLTVSLDALDEHTFRQMNDVDFAVADVLRGIDAAHEAGLGPVKINMVVKRGLNDHQIVPMARHFKNTPAILRFIEYMDVGSSNGWRMDDVVTADDIVARIGSELPLEPLARNYSAETARRWRYLDGGGEIGVIASVTRSFCQDCTRARLSTEGKLYNCLFASKGADLRELLRAGHSDAEINTVIAQLWQARDDRYSDQRTAASPAVSARKVEMSYIGG